MSKSLTLLEGGPLLYPFHVLDTALHSGMAGVPQPNAFSLSTDDGMKVVFKGTFTIANGAITGGTVTGFDVFYGSTKVMTAGGHAVDYAAVADAITEATGWNTTPFEDLFAANARINGSSAEDTIFGSEGGKLLGKDGNDYLLAGEGKTKLDGGDGDDIFVFFNNLPTSADTIKDFDVKHDVIALYPSSFDKLPVGFVDDASFAIGKVATTSDEHVIYDKKAGALYWDADGSGASGLRRRCRSRGSTSTSSFTPITSSSAISSEARRRCTYRPVHRPLTAKAGSPPRLRSSPTRRPRR